MAYSSDWTENVLKKKKKRKEEEEKYSKYESQFVNDALSGKYKSIKTTNNNTTTSQPIAPIKEQNTNSWFKSGAFSDGYQFGDGIKTILGTAGDIGVNVVKGVGNLAEGVTDAALYATSGVADFFGADNFADDTRNLAKKNSVNDFLEPAESFVDQASVLGDKSDNISQGLGYVGGLILTGGAGAAAGLGRLATTALTTGLTFTSGTGGGMSEAYQSGATDEEALQYGLIAGTAEAATELLFGGLGKAVGAAGLSSGTGLDDALARKISSKFQSQLAKNFTQYGIKAGAEGTEEVLSGVLQAWGKSVTYQDEKEFGKILKDEKLLDQFITGAITSGIAQSGYIPGMKQGSLKEANKTGRDFISGYTQNEQSVIDAETRKRINEQTTDKPLTKKQQNEIKNQVEEDFKKGNISTDTIESVLGGEKYNELKSTREIVKKIENEVKTLENKENITNTELSHLNNLRQELEQLDTNTLENDFQSEMSTKIAKDGYLQQAYQEKAKKGRSFTYIAEQVTDENAKGVYESAANVMNDTTRSHEFADSVAKIAQEKGIKYEFVNNEILEKQKYKAGINGVVTKDGKVLINVDSAKALNVVVGHETTHVLEGTQEYKDLQEAVFNYAREKGEYDSRHASLYSLYKDIEGANVDNELTADLVGDYLFTDTGFVQSLSTQKPTVFEKIKELIDDLVIKFKGTKEEKALREVQKKFKEAYKQSVSNSENRNSSVQYSLNRGELNGENNLDGRGSVTSSEVIQSQEVETKNGEREYTRTEWQNFERKSSETRKTSLNENEQNISNKVKNNHNKEVVFFDDKDSLYLGGASLENPNIVYVSSDLDTDTKNYIAHHEIMESYIAHNKTLKDSYIESAMEEILYDSGYQKTKASFLEGQTDLDNVPDRMIAKDIICDYFAEQETGVKTDYDLHLSDTTLEVIDYNIQAFVKEIKNQNRYSLSTDNQGRTLTKEQQEYFKDSKVRDENGDLLEVYHGTNVDFNVFNYDNFGVNGNRYGTGFYFTDDIKEAEHFTNNETIKKVYLNIKKPLNAYGKKMSYSKFSKIFNSLNEYGKNNIDNYNNEEIFGTNENAKKFGHQDNISKSTYDFYNNSNSNAELMEAMFIYSNKMGLDIPTSLNIFEKATGNDGMVGEMDNGKKIYVTFNSNQIKNVDNTNPTSDPDIRYSLGEDTAPKQSNLTYGEDVKIQEAIAPLKETVDNLVNDLTTKIARLNEELDKREFGVPTTMADIQDIEAQYEENLDSSIANADFDNNNTDETSFDYIGDLPRIKGKQEVINNISGELSVTKVKAKEIYDKLATNDHLSTDDVFYELLKHNEFTEKSIDPEIKEAKNYIKGTKLNISELKKQITDYNNSYRMSNMGRGLTLGNKGQKVDSFYQELSEKYPQYFPSDITTEIDQLDTITYFLQDDGVTEQTYTIDENTLYEIAERIHNDITIKSKYEASINQIEESNKYTTDADAPQLDIAPLRTVNEAMTQESTDNVQMKLEEDGSLTDDVVYDDKQRVKQRKSKREELGVLVRDLIGDTSKWKDKKLGIQYQMNTLQRNLRDIVRDSLGRKDITRADAIYNELQGKYNEHEARLKVEGTRIKQPFAEMKINKYEDPYIQMLGEFKYNPDTTLTQVDIDTYYNKYKNKIDVDKVNSAIESARQTYDELFTRVNQTLREQGMKEIPYRQGYFPHFIEEKQSLLAKIFDWRVRDDNIPTDIAGMTENFNPERSWQSFNQHRQSDKTTYNFSKGMDTYVQGALDWIYHIDDIQKRRAFENEIRYQHSEQGVKEQIDKLYEDSTLDTDEIQDRIDLIYATAENPLNNFIVDFRNATNNLTGKKSTIDRNMEYATNRKVYQTMTNISNRVSGNMIGGSFSAALSNFIPITQSWGEVSPIQTLKAVKNAAKALIQDDGTIDKSTFLTNRLRKNENLYKSNWDKVSDKVGLLMESVDFVTSQVVWRSKYQQNLQQGMSEQQAINNADNYAERLIAGRSRGNMPTIFNSKNPITKMLTSFQLEVNNQYAYLFKDMPTEMANKSKANLIKGYVGVFAGAYLYNSLYSMLTGRDVAFDPIAILEDFLTGDDDEDELDNLAELGENVAKNIPFVGGLMGGGRVPISAMLPYDNPIKMITGTAEDLAKLSDPEKKEAALKDLTSEWLNPVTYLALPFGGGQIRKTVEGLSMFDEDLPTPGNYTSSGDLRYTVENTPLNVLQAGVFGKWANKSAQEYIDDGFHIIKSTKVNEMMDLGMNSTDYRNLKSDISNAGTKNAEKVDYIANREDLTTEQKNILVNDVLDRDYQVDVSNYTTYEAFDYSYKNPEKYLVSKAITNDFQMYKTYTDDLNNIKADTKNGKTISGSKKKKIFNYINNLSIGFEQKVILTKMYYPNYNEYNSEIIDYLDKRNDITYEDEVTILKELGFTVYDDGRVTW